MTELEKIENSIRALRKNRIHADFPDDGIISANLLLNSLSENIPDAESSIALFLGDCYDKKGNKEESKKLYKKVFHDSTRRNNEVYIAYALSELAKQQLECGNFFMAIGDSQRAYEILAASPKIDSYFLNLSLVILATSLMAVGDTERAILFYTKGIQLNEEQKDYHWLFYIVHNLSEIYLTIRNFTESIYFAEESLRYGTLMQNPTMLTKALMRLASIKIEMEEIEEVKQILIKIDQVKSSDPILQGTLNMVIGKVRQKEKFLDEAIAEYKKAAVIFSQYGKLDLEVNSLIHQSEVLIFQEKFNDAEQILLKCREMSLQSKNLYGLLSSNESLAKVYKLFGDHAKALDYYEQFYENEKRQFTEESDKRLKLLQVQFDVEKKKGEAELYKLKSEQFERELSNKTIYLVRQTELLAKFRDDLRLVVREGKTAEDVVRGLKVRLKELPCSSIDWEQYDEQFRTVHPHFRDNLLERYPGLTEMETKVCSLIRIDLTSKSIGRLLCLTERNIENHRYRIRKKMNLALEQNLQEVLKEI